MDKSSKQKINKDTTELNSTINQLYIIDMYGLIHPAVANHTFFSNTHGIHTKMDHVL